MSNGTTIIEENDRFKVAHWRGKLYLIDKADKSRPYVYFIIIGHGNKESWAKWMMERAEADAAKSHSEGKHASRTCHAESVTGNRKEASHG